MMSLKIRLVCTLVELLARYQAHLELQLWLKQQRRLSYSVAHLGPHLAKDVGADPDGVLRPKQEDLPAKPVNYATRAKVLQQQRQRLKIPT